MCVGDDGFRLVPFVLEAVRRPPVLPCLLARFSTPGSFAIVLIAGGSAQRHKVNSTLSLRAPVSRDMSLVLGKIQNRLAAYVQPIRGPFEDTIMFIEKRYATMRGV